MSSTIQEMDTLSVESPLTALKGIGPVRSERLARSGLSTVLDLLLYLPTGYEDRRHRLRIDQLEREGAVLLSGRLLEPKRVFVRRRGMTLIRARLEDESGVLPILWFNQPYLLERLNAGDRYSLYGRVRYRGGAWEMINPSCEVWVEGEDRPGIMPVYRQLEGVSSGAVRRLVKQALDASVLDDLQDPVPTRLRRVHDLPALAASLSYLHEPPESAEMEALAEHRTLAHARLAYGEFLELQLELGYLRHLEVQSSKKHRYAIERQLRALFAELLPFTLTRSQELVLEEILADLGAPQPMLRLLQGDVGCGKTIMAVLALVVALENDLQGAFMAPTELLAEQHYESVTAILGTRYRVGLLTGSTEDRGRLRRQVAAGTIQLVVGTHALIQKDLEFSQLGLAVVDEQHRFGVGQRRLLQSKGDQPDLLVMTATPIPRSLALTVYGDLALSIIDELPPGRRRVATRVVADSHRESVYSWLRQRLESGSQAYLVFPLIEDSDRVPVESLSSLGERVREQLGPFETAVVHGRMESATRHEIMRRFRDGEIQALLATTVIEVGVDVANATIMVIESGERFGLSQLHQLRGRVGRGSQRSHCVVIHGRLSEDAQRRLQVFADTDDGFRIAEADLEIRGPGDLLGTRQSGVPLFRLADLVRDRHWLERARSDARELLSREPDPPEVSYLEPIRRRAQSRYESFAGG